MFYGIERGDKTTDLASLICELNTHGSAIGARTLVVQKSHFHELFEIVGNV